MEDEAAAGTSSTVARADRTTDLQLALATGLVQGGEGMHVNSWVSLHTSTTRAQQIVFTFPRNIASGDTAPAHFFV